MDTIVRWETLCLPYIPTIVFGNPLWPNLSDVTHSQLSKAL